MSVRLPVELVGRCHVQVHRDTDGLVVEDDADRLAVVGEPVAPVGVVHGTVVTDGVCADTVTVDAEQLPVQVALARLLGVGIDHDVPTVVEAGPLRVMLGGWRNDPARGVWLGLEGRRHCVVVEQARVAQPVGHQDLLHFWTREETRAEVRHVGGRTGVVLGAGAARSERQQRSNHNGCDDSGHATRSHLFAPSDLSG